MPETAAQADRGHENGSVIAGCYVVDAFLGQGGMGSVYRVRHAQRGDVLALKRLRREQLEARPALGVLFEREFHTLRQLAHPNIVEAYDYGCDEDGPYYTMELLGGEDLHALSPLPYREACALLREVASALAIVHSRRLLHRDVSPRNVRRGADGRTKLFDFGALAAIGVSGELIGTPPCVCPEVLHGQPLDPRADLYALGALSYFTLTGRHAYASATLAGLRDSWRSRPRPPSAYAPDVPAALDELVMSLLSLDPLARPVSAGEVIDRLTALAELPPTDVMQTAQAYLCAPTLVGRDEIRMRFRKQLLRAGRGRGGVVLLDAPPGLGRTRLLQTLELEAKLTNALVLGVGCGADAGELSSVRSLVTELMLIAPDQALAAVGEDKDLLSRALPALRQAPNTANLRRPSCPPDGGPQLDAAECEAAAAAIARWLIELTHHRTLVLALDDIHLCDLGSLSILAQVAQSAARARMYIVMSVQQGARPRAHAALSLIRRHAMVLTPAPLTDDEVQLLAGSLFGDVAHVALVGRWMARLSEGNPRTCMELAQHLIDRSIVRYEHGAWLLPQLLQEGTLPGSLDEALQVRLQNLSSSTQSLIYALSLTEWRVRLDEYALLLGEGSSIAEVSSAIDEAVGAGVLVAVEDTYRFAHRGLRDAAYKLGSAHPQHPTLRRRLARLYELRQDYNSRAAHLLAAGDEAEAVESELRYQRGLRNYRLGLGTNVPARITNVEVLDDTTIAVGTHTRLLEAAERLGYPPHVLFELRATVTTLAFVYDLSFMRGHIERQLERLSIDSGAIYLDEFAEPGQDAVASAKSCLEKARAVHAAQSEADRGLAPDAALTLAVTSIAHSQILGLQSYEQGPLERALRLADFMRKVSPRAEIMYKAALQSYDSMCGRVEAAAAVRQELLAIYAAAIAKGHAPPTATYGRGLQAAAEGIHRAQYGGDSAVRWADELEQVRLVGEHGWKRRAWAVRRLMHMHNGNAIEAARCRDEIDQLASRYAYAPYGAGTAFLEAQACALCGDLPGLKQARDAIEQIVERQYPRWQPFLDIARSEYARLRGNASEALTHADQALCATEPGGHAAWGPAACSRAGALLALDRAGEAADFAREALVICQREQLGPFVALSLMRVLSLAEAVGGACQPAAERLQEALALAETNSIEGIALAVLHEASARVAIAALDQEAFERHAARAAALYRTGRNPALVAKYERLMHAARSAKLQLSVELTHAAEASSARGGNDREFSHTRFEGMSQQERYQQGLTLLLEHTGTAEGFLYALGEDGALSLVASSADATPPEGLLESLQAYIQAELDESIDATRTCFDSDPGATLDTAARDVAAFRPVLIGESVEGRVLACGIAALRHDGGYVAPDWSLVSTVNRVLRPQPEAQDVVSLFG